MSESKAKLAHTAELLRNRIAKSDVFYAAYLTDIMNRLVSANQLCVDNENRILTINDIIEDINEFLMYQEEYEIALFDS